jgi:hypothetical protein
VDFDWFLAEANPFGKTEFGNSYNTLRYILHKNAWFVHFALPQLPDSGQFIPPSKHKCFPGNIM